MEKGLPHPNQTAYRKRVSCAEAIFSTFEAISQFAQHGEKMYLCFYDLQKAFDSVQYPILLKRLYHAGINGKTWRLLRNWYHKPKSRVRVGGQLSPVYTLERGVLQGFCSGTHPLPANLRPSTQKVRAQQPWSLHTWDLCQCLCSCR